MMGVRPLRFQGQFQAHNFNLPYASFSFRDDADFFAASGWKKNWNAFTIRAGLAGTFVFRDETLLESSVADLASRPIKQIMLTQKSRGIFFDISARIEFKEMLAFSYLLKNAGKFSRASLLREDMLYLSNDKDPLHIYSLGYLPKIGIAKIHFGFGLIQFAQKIILIKNSGLLLGDYF